MIKAGAVDGAKIVEFKTAATSVFLAPSWLRHHRGQEILFMSVHTIVYEREIFDFSIPVENMSPEECWNQLQYLDSFHDNYGHSGLLDASGQRVVDLDERRIELQIAILAGEDLLTKVRCAHYEHTEHGANVGDVLKQVIGHLEGGE